MLAKLQMPTCRVVTRKNAASAHGAGCRCCGRARGVRVSAAAPAVPAGQKDGLVRIVDEEKVSFSWECCVSGARPLRGCRGAPPRRRSAPLPAHVTARARGVNASPHLRAARPLPAN